MKIIKRYKYDHKIFITVICLWSQQVVSSIRMVRAMCISPQSEKKKLTARIILDENRHCFSFGVNTFSLSEVLRNKPSKHGHLAAKSFSSQMILYRFFAILRSCESKNEDILNILIYCNIKFYHLFISYIFFLIFSIACLIQGLHSITSSNGPTKFLFEKLKETLLHQNPINIWRMSLFFSIISFLYEATTVYLLPNLRVLILF